MREELTGLSRTQPMTEHTPTPWAIAEVKTSVGLCFKIGSDEMLNAAGKLTYVCVYDDYGYGDNAQHANVNFIVTAVNSIGPSLDALKEMCRVRGLAEDTRYWVFDC